MSIRDKAKRSAYNRQYSQANADRIRQQHLKYRIQNIDAINARDVENCRVLKLAAFNRYGGPCCCLCPESRLHALTIDHIAGDGGKHRASTRCSSGKKFYQWLKTNEYPTGFRVLCVNCNWREYRRMKEPIELKSKYAIRQKVLKLNKKKMLMDQLGGKCTICGIDDTLVLTVHHQNNNGAEHRRMISGGVSGYAFYCAIIRSGDIDGLECRCFSCNSEEEWRS